ncbi:MAG TPA: hypothetical protein DD458_11545 [Prolixibacteraceae bacterium]|nr:hypothetical protein [Marinilabiliales bacterium]HBL75852.1 hypothetical protein [Prolixibacteraceae bacterium]HCU63101.1 hypothetical protein [Prolixibacteraceae bacterium]
MTSVLLLLGMVVLLVGGSYMIYLRKKNSFQNFRLLEDGFKEHFTEQHSTKLIPLVCL